MNHILASMRLDERYADAAARAETLSNQLADLRDVFESLGLSDYADVASEMADDLTIQSIHMKRMELEHDPSMVTPGILAEMAGAK